MVCDIFSTNPHFDSFVCFTQVWGPIFPSLNKRAKVSKKYDRI